jgi:hemolysin III
VGFFAAVIGLVILLFVASMRGTTSHVIGASVFGVTLVLLYGASTVYHGLPHSRAKDVMQKIDHLAIYLLIAGTYTPFLLMESLGLQGEIALVLVWVLAASGIIFELVRSTPGGRISIALYLGMGWLAVFVLEPLARALEPTGVVLLVAGGLVYSIGVCFYAWTKLPYNHAVWHGFVLGGSGLHFASVLGFVLP